MIQNMGCDFSASFKAGVHIYFFPVVVDFVFHESCPESELFLCIFQELAVRACLIDYRVLQCLDYPCEMNRKWEGLLYF